MVRHPTDKLFPANSSRDTTRRHEALQAEVVKCILATSREIKTGKPWAHSGIHRKMENSWNERIATCSATQFCICFGKVNGNP